MNFDTSFYTINNSKSYCAITNVFKDDYKGRLLTGSSLAGGIIKYAMFHQQQALVNYHHLQKTTFPQNQPRHIHNKVIKKWFNEGVIENFKMVCSNGNYLNDNYEG